jgi:hypothetical protein
MARVCGDGYEFTRAQLKKVNTPKGTASWCPIPHDVLVSHVERSLTGMSLEVADEQYLVARDGKRMFGVLDLRSKSDKDYGLAVGLRNSHDMTFPVGLLLGARVFVCSNLSFSGEEKVQTKHTKYVMDRLPRLVMDATNRLMASRVVQDRRIATYKATEIEPKKEAAYIMLQAIRTDVIPTRLIDRLMERWEFPTHDEFAASWSAWRMFNAATEVLKEASPLLLAERTQRLHTLMDNHCGLIGTKVLSA